MPRPQGAPAVRLHHMTVAWACLPPHNTSQVLAELKELMAYRQKHFPEGAPKILALGLSSRKNLCIHPWVAGA